MTTATKISPTTKPYKVTITERTHEDDPSRKYLLVEPHFAGVDRECTGGISVGTSRQLAERVQLCMLAGAFFGDTTLRSDVDDKTYVNAPHRCLGRRLNADLRKLGY